MNHRFIAHIGKSLTLAGLLVLAHSVQAIDYSWNNGAGGTFSTSGNWTPPGPPTTGDRATFGLTGGFTVDFAAIANSDYLVVTSGNTVTFDLGGNTYNVNSGPAIPTPTTLIGSNAADNVKLVVTDGTLNLQNNTSYKYALLAANGSTATLEVNSSGGGGGQLPYNYMDVGAGGTLIVQGAGSSASGGPGYLNMNAGTLIISNSATATLANFTSSGTITVDNASVTTYASIARVIQSGGAVNIINGASWNTGAHQFEMGVSGGSGIVNVGNGVGTSFLTGGQVMFGTTFDPNRGSPEMIINSGGLVRPLNTIDSFFIYDRGTATLNGGNIEIVPGGQLDIADINNNNAEEGLLRGAGAISRFGIGLNFTLTNDGDFRPGDTNATARIGTVAISGGDLVQNSGGTTFFDFASSGNNDFVSFSIGGGTATIGGTNVFTILDGYIPQIGDRWDFVLADDITYTASDNIQALMTSYGLQNDYMFGVFDSGAQEVLSLIIPEPSATMLLGLGGLMLLRRRRKS